MVQIKIEKYLLIDYRCGLTPHQRNKTKKNTKKTTTPKKTTKPTPKKTNPKKQNKKVRGDEKIEEIEVAQRLSSNC